MTDFNSNETNNSLLSSASSFSSFLPVPGILELIPPFVRDMCKSPKNVEMRVAFDAPTQQSTYTYSINWEDNENSDDKYLKILQKSISRSTSIGSLNTIKSTTVVHDVPPPVTAICDGPCKKAFPSNLLNTIGRCGHYLCTACYGILKNSDGTTGCSSRMCYWKGKDRKEAKKNFEKEVCRKQRLRAREMKSRGIDVKSASSASSRTSPSPHESSEETDCAVGSVMDNLSNAKGDFRLIYPLLQEMIGVKLYVLEQLDILGVQHNVVELEVQSTTKVNRVITSLLREYFQTLPPDQSGVLYHVELEPGWSRRVRRVRTKQYNSLELYNFSKVDEYIVFVMDFGAFLKNGVKINFV
ncbi:RING-type domain-containing protein [Caenorhabditis elegans]|uniref:RING-type domain-containing protein n=1 Tax=Caenorhabditis elegans TaxID=6239 RepID=Q21600_CAEEL|nr:RING-type domain-containing protein [Caenorhabditis elegans]CAA84333.1 RING-type domain-containing protein [Caenorhabditis elegans]|eukprot:NP_497921.1 Uncharacterized protein CELE_M88.3 [Caenorhabditis elegans]